MNDLRRWLDEEPPAEVRRLLEVGQFERPSPVLLDQVLDQVRLTGAGGTNSRSPAGPGGLARLGGKLLLGVLLIGAGALLVRELGSSGHPEPVQPLGSGLAEFAPPLPPVAPAGPAAEARALAEERVLANERAPLGAAASADEARAGRPAPESSASGRRVARAAQVASKASKGRVCEPAVPQQIELLEQARRELRGGRGTQALATLDRYDRWGAGRCFVLESLEVRMDAYLATGNRTAAERVATSLRKHYPGTAQARAAERVLAR